MVNKMINVNFAREVQTYRIRSMIVAMLKAEQQLDMLKRSRKKYDPEAAQTISMVNLPDICNWVPNQLDMAVRARPDLFQRSTHPKMVAIHKFVVDLLKKLAEHPEKHKEFLLSHARNHDDTWGVKEYPPVAGEVQTSTDQVEEDSGSSLNANMARSRGLEL